MYLLIISISFFLLLIHLYKRVRNPSLKALDSFERCKNTFESNRLKYDKLKRRSSPDPSIPFWDIIVITASDTSQRNAYQLQIEQKMKNKLIPSFCTYRVYPDPVGVKIGSGGATMWVLDHLRNEFGWKEVSKKRVMLIHAGGYSQRLPSLTAIGKLSISLPIGNGSEFYQVLEGLLISFLYFPMRMSSGVMLCASDALFMFSDDSTWKLDCDGLVSLGNVVTLEEGVGHGVLDFEGMQEVWKEHYQGGSQVYLRKCNQFLHKYLAQDLRSKGVVYEDGLGNEFVYQDSNYFMSWNAAEKILSFYDANQPIKCEIDAYGDFLKAAAAPNDDYIYDTRNVVHATPALVQTRKDVYIICKHLSLHALVFNTGNYLHFGTSKEYIGYATDLSGRLLSKSKEIFVGKSNDCASLYQDNVRVMASFLKDPATLSIARGSILEYCLVESNVFIGDNCFISHCHIPPETNIQDNIYMFTVATRKEGEIGYVTPVFGIQDNLKKNTHLSNIQSISYVNSNLETINCMYKKEGYKIFNNQEFVSLWNARIFPISSSPTASVDIEHPHVWQDSKQHIEDILCADISFPYLVTGSYDGMLILWNTETEKELNRTKSGVKIRVDVPFKRAPSRQGDSLMDILQRPSSHKLSSRERGRISPNRLHNKSVPQEEHVPVDFLLFLKERLSQRVKDFPHLISSEGGYAVFWDIFHFTRPRQTIRLTRYPNETVLGLATDPLNTILISGDTRGEIRIFSLNTSNTVKVSASSQQIQGMDCIVLWKAHDSSIVSVEYIPGEGDMSFVLSASVDRNVRLWTLEGDYVGNFGTQFWDLKNPSSYQHPKTPWGSKKTKVQIISRASSRESTPASFLQSSPAVSRVPSLAEDIDLITVELPDRIPQSPLPTHRTTNLITQSSKFFSLQPDPNLEPVILTDSEKQLHFKGEMLLSSSDKLDIEERMKRRSVRRARFQYVSIDKTERFPMLCSAYQALELTEIRYPDFQPMCLPPISRETK
ncbi:hypothetical protein LOD99_10821 [Oopsacas minuta]|uniref:GDP-fucose pyrophosphorylase domain-containing protein n=1 Tax=Oopsacas minuta TaxID=111878 RepID=A0AAV7KDL9_9METZ|nr:hypothetical protein LOD99_10821 [Oopsacas minuta]